MMDALQKQDKHASQTHSMPDLEQIQRIIDMTTDYSVHIGCILGQVQFKSKFLYFRFAVVEESAIEFHEVIPTD
jgi:hypothetical protein